MGWEVVAEGIEDEGEGKRIKGKGVGVFVLKGQRTASG